MFEELIKKLVELFGEKKPAYVPIPAQYPKKIIGKRLRF